MNAQNPVSILFSVKFLLYNFASPKICNLDQSKVEKYINVDLLLIIEISWQKSKEIPQYQNFQGNLFGN